MISNYDHLVKLFDGVVEKGVGKSAPVLLAQIFARHSTPGKCDGDGHAPIENRQKEDLREACLIYSSIKVSKKRFGGRSSRCVQKFIFG